MPVEKIGTEGVSPLFQQFVRDAAAGKENDLRLFNTELKNVHITVIPAAKEGEAPSVVFTKSGLEMDKAKVNALRDSLYTTATHIINNANIKDEAGKTVDLSKTVFGKVDLNSNKKVDAEDIVASFLGAAEAKLDLPKDAPAPNGPTFDGDVLSGDLKITDEKAFAEKSAALYNITFNATVLEKMPEPPKPIKVEGSAFKLTDLIIAGTLKNRAEKIDAPKFYEMITKQSSVDTSNPVKTIVSPEQAAWLSSYPNEQLPTWFAEQIVKRSGMEEILPQVMAKADAVTKGGKKFTFGELTAAVMSSLHENHMLANGGKDASDLDVMLASGAILDNWMTPTAPASPTVAQTAPQSLVAGTVPTQLPAPGASLLPGATPWSLPIAPTTNGALLPAISSLGVPGMQPTQPAYTYPVNTGNVIEPSIQERFLAYQQYVRNKQMTAPNEQIMTFDVFLRSGVIA